MSKRKYKPGTRVQYQDHNLKMKATLVKYNAGGWPVIKMDDGKSRYNGRTYTVFAEYLKPLRGNHV